MQNVFIDLVPHGLAEPEETASVVGTDCIEAFKNFNISKSFMACTSLSLRKGASNATLEECNVKKTAMQLCQTHYLLVDSSKYDQSSLVSFAALSDFDYIISDAEPSKEYIDTFKKNNTEFVIAR